jgi:hypothetical protein
LDTERSVILTRLLYFNTETQVYQWPECHKFPSFDKMYYSAEKFESQLSVGSIQHKCSALTFFSSPASAAAGGAPVLADFDDEADARRPLAGALDLTSVDDDRVLLTLPALDLALSTGLIGLPAGLPAAGFPCGGGSATAAAACRPLSFFGDTTLVAVAAFGLSSTTAGCSVELWM